MKTLLMTACVAGSMVVCAESVGFKSVGGISVDSGSERTLDETLTLSPEAKFYKSGAGTLTIPSAKIENGAPYQIDVVAGKLVVSGAAAARGSAVSAPSVVTDKAAVWLDATPLTEGDSVSTWNDARGDAGRYSAVARWHNAGANDGIPPVVSVTNGIKGVNFGGQSGKYLAFQLAQADSVITKVFHFFVVHGVYTTYGTVLGNSKSSRGVGILTTTTSKSTIVGIDSTAYSYFVGNRMDLDANNAQGRFFLDGRFFDPYTTRIRKGVSLLEGDMQARPQEFNVIFDNYFETHKETDLDVPGGDYMHEVLIYTNMLTETERMDVERYLLNKWNLPQTEVKTSSKGRGISRHPRGTGMLKVAEGAEVEVTAAANETTVPLQLDGGGSAVKKGAGTMLIGGGMTRPFGGSFDLQEGALLVHGGVMPPVTLKSGERWDASNWPIRQSATTANDETSGVRIVKTALSDDSAVRKTGSGEVVASGIATGAKRVVVEKGVLHLTAKEEDAVVTDTESPLEEIEIPNHSFEATFPWTDTYGRVYGWKSMNGWDGSSAQFVTMNCARWNAWSSDCYPIPDGTNALMLVCGGAASTTVTIARAGTYEISFYAAGRYGSANGPDSDLNGRRAQVRVLFDGNVVGWNQVNRTAFTKFRYRFTVTKSQIDKGARKELKFATYRSYVDDCTIIDDVHLVAIPEADGTEIVKVPGGDFEQSDRIMADGSTPMRLNSWFSRDMCGPDWTLTLTEDAANANPTNGYVGFCTQGTPTYYSAGYPFSRAVTFYPQADGVTGCGVLGFIGSCGVATTKSAFHLPKGKWKLRGEIAYMGGNYNAPFDKGEGGFTSTPGIQVTVTRSSSTLDLGTGKPIARHTLRRYTWPTVVEVGDGGEDIALSVRQTVSNAACILDNLEFVPAAAGDYTENLFKNPSFESNTYLGKYTYPMEDKYESYTGWFTYITDSWAFGYDVVDGDCCYRIHNNVGLSTEVEFPVAGLYRLIVPAHSRVDDISFNHIRFCASVVLKDGTELKIFDQPPPFVQSYQEIAYLFRMPEAGVHNVRIYGVPAAAVYNAKNVNTRNSNTMIDGIRLYKVEEGLTPPSVPEDTTFVIQEGTRLGLDYEGTLRVRGLRLGGKGVHGTVSAATHPDFITGMGRLEVEPLGLTVIID